MNLLKKILMLCVHIAILAVNAQVVTNPSVNNTKNNAYFNNEIPKITPPDVASFQETKLVNVSSYSGSTNVNIPLYEIKEGDITIPIRLNYNSTGVKANEVASNVGLNWSLEAGGKITKVIKGVEDFSINFSENYCKDNFNNCESYPNLSDEITYDNFNNPKYYLHNFRVRQLGWFVSANDISIQDFYNFSKNNNDRIIPKRTNKYNDVIADTYPDFFHANAPGLSTKFTHDSNLNPFEIEKQGNLITTSIGKSGIIPFKESFYRSDFVIDFVKQYWGSKPRKITCINDIKIKNINGLEYNFDLLDVNQYVTRSNSNITQDLKVSSQEVTSYHLSQIKDTKGNIIRFSYESFNSEQTIDSKSNTYVVNGDKTVSFTQEPSITEVYYPQLNRIKTIYFKTGSVNFIYSHERQDLPNNQALEFIEVKDVFGKTIKRYQFVYDYFRSNTMCSSHYCYRLKLTEVIETDKVQLIGVNKLRSYKLYYDETKLPELGTTQVDYLGYANGVKESYYTDRSPLYPKNPYKLFFSPNKGRFSISPIEMFNNSIKINNGLSLSPSLKYTKAGSLIKIQRPTGALQYFNYELNTFSTSENKNITSAGLRIKNQYIIDESGKVELSESYIYKGDDGYSSGRLNSIPVYGDVWIHDPTKLDKFYKDPEKYLKEGKVTFRTHSSGQNNMRLVMGNDIGYSKITVVNGIDNGVREQNFYTIEDYPIDYPTTDLRSSHLNYLIDNGATLPYYNNKEVLLGKLKSELSRNNEGDLVSKTQFTYNYKRFKEMDIEIPMDESKLRYIPKGGFGSTNSDVYPIFNVYPRIYSHRNLVSKSITKEYVEEDKSVVTETGTVYDVAFPLVKETKIKTNDNEEVVVKNYYPHEVFSKETLPRKKLSDTHFMAINKLKAVNKIARPIQVENYKNNQLLFSNRINYNDWGSGVLAPVSVEFSKGNKTLSLQINQKYDTYGNLIEISKEEGTHIAYIYGYNNALPVAKIEGAKISDIPQSYIEDIKKASNLDNDRTQAYIGKEGNVRKQLNKLYNLTALKKSQITLYTYDPLVGITSITDPRGDVIYYEYDKYNRLKVIKNNEGYILKEHQYNYKN